MRVRSLILTLFALWIDTQGAPLVRLNEVELWLAGIKVRQLTLFDEDRSDSPKPSLLCVPISLVNGI